jgi:aminoglycoside phosphotransferase (APT) family kinase protein
MAKRNARSREQLDAQQRTVRWIALVPLRRTLIHGDPQVDNVLFEDKTEGPRACLIDWQRLRVGDPQCDVANFLTGSMAPKDRQAAERAFG